jgi:hypothetical protein
MTPHRAKWIAAAAMVATGAAGVIVAAAVAAPTGCASDCGSNCPNATVYIGNLDNRQLWIDDILVSGPACPPQHGVYCIGDGVTTSCTHFTITGQAQGICDVLIVFPDRPAMIVRTEFGPPIQQGCCKGHTIVGDSIFVIPANSDAGISGVDGPSDAVTTVVDGGASDAGGDGN